MLRRIHIKGFRSFRDSGPIELGALNVLVGANGAGKSNFIEVFRFLHAVVAQRLQRYVQQAGGADALFYGGVKSTPILSIDVDINDNGYRIALEPTPNGVVIGDEATWFFAKGHDEKPYREELGSGHIEAKLPKRTRVSGHTANAIRAWVPYHFHDTSSTAAIKQPHEIADNVALGANAGNLAAFLLSMRARNEGAYDAIVRTIRQVAPFFDDFVLVPDAVAPDRIALRWRETSSESTRGATQLSDGTLRFIAIATALLQPDPPETIIIDEPELGLHPAAIHVLAGLLRIAARNTQLVVATQSVTLLNQLEPDALFVLDRVEDATRMRRLEPSEYERWIDEYALGEVWEKGVIGGRPQ